MSVHIIQIFKVDAPEERKGKDGNPYVIRSAQTALLDDDGALQKVGRLPYQKEMEDKIKVGTFTATFSLDVAQWGKNKGDIISVITDLVPYPPVAPAKPAALAPLKA